MTATPIHSTKVDKVFDVFNYTIMIILLAIVIYPLWFIVIASFSDPNAVNAGEVWLLPKDIMLDGYKRILLCPKFGLVIKIQFIILLWVQ